MQDRYAGDIGDFGKFGLLRFVEDEDLSVGVNWYLTKPINEIESKKNDGKHEIKDKYRECDIELFNALKDVFNAERNIKSIEIKQLLKTNMYYSKLINIDNRDGWHNDALQQLSNCDVIFLDPDNGLEVDSAKHNKKMLSKYVLLEEVKSYLDKKKSVIFYNQRSRKKPKPYFEDLYNRLKSTNIKPFSISFHRGTVRDYIILANAKHEEQLRNACTKMLESEWGSKKMKLCQKDNDD